VFTRGKKWAKVARRANSGAPALKGELEQMFLGQYQHSMDAKGRLTIPSRFRELLVSDGAYVTLGFDQNLLVLTEPFFLQVSERVRRMSLTEPHARLLKRLIFSSAERVEVDKAGRILIPEFLRKAAGLDGEAVVVGAGDYIEVWEPKRWEGQLDLLQDAEANTQRFAVLDLST
jgi:MraZ protein